MEAQGGLGTVVCEVGYVCGLPWLSQIVLRIIDAVLLLKTYHEVANPVALMHNLRSALRPDARIGIIDRNGSGADHGVQKSVVVQEMSQAGYVLKDEKDGLVTEDKVDYFLIFAAK